MEQGWRECEANTFEQDLKGVSAGRLRGTLPIIDACLPSPLAAHRRPRLPPCRSMPCTLGARRKLCLLVSWVAAGWVMGSGALLHCGMHAAGCIA